MKKERGSLGKRIELAAASLPVAGHLFMAFVGVALIVFSFSFIDARSFPGKWEDISVMFLGGVSLFVLGTTLFIVKKKQRGE